MNKISINQKECIGCSFCVGATPEFFKYDEKDFKAKLGNEGNLSDELSFELSAEQRKQVKETADNCPVRAIKIL
jgi:ferredoxin